MQDQEISDIAEEFHVIKANEALTANLERACRNFNSAYNEIGSATDAIIRMTSHEPHLFVVNRCSYEDCQGKDHHQSNDECTATIQRMFLNAEISLKRSDVEESKVGSVDRKQRSSL